jgi:hypothetical protein
VSGVETPPRSPSGPDGPRGTPSYRVDPEEVVALAERFAPDLPGDTDLADLVDTPEPWDLQQLGTEAATTLPAYDLPTFGTAGEHCGEAIPPAMHFCEDCGAVEAKPHVCYRHDCPQHGLAAVRRRAAGTGPHASGVVPQLDALARYLGHHRNEAHHFFHLALSPPAWWAWGRDDPLEAAYQFARELLDILGLQGLVAVHPFAEAGSGPGERGAWKHRLGKKSEWAAVAPELEHRPHIHLVGVAPELDLEPFEEVRERTGWVLAHKGNSAGLGERAALAQVSRTVTYTLSHCGVRDAGSQRRLTARMKGPDVDHVRPRASHAALARQIVYQVSQDTLGLAPPDLSCGVVDERDDGGGDQSATAGVEATSAGVEPATPPPDSPLMAAWDSDLEGSTGGAAPPVVTGPTAGAFGGGGGDAVGAVGHRPTDLPAQSVGLEAGSVDGGGGGGVDVVGGEADPLADVTGPDGGPLVARDGADACGGRLRHISLAGRFLVDGAVRERLAHADQLAAAYRTYEAWCRARALETDARPGLDRHGDGLGAADRPA